MATTDISAISPGYITVQATITNLSSHRIRNGNLMIEAVIADKTGTTKAVWFAKQLNPDLVVGTEYTFEGKYELKYGRLALQQPKFEATGAHPEVSTLAAAPFVLPAKNYRGRKKSFDWSGTIGALFVLGWIGYIVIYGGYSMISGLVRGSQPGGNVSQSYLYCWDSGDPSPHHLGHHVAGDHLCTDGELGK